MIISGIHIGNEFDHTAMVQLQQDVVTGVIRVPGHHEDDSMEAILALSNMADLTVVDASSHGLHVFHRLRHTLPHKKITGVCFTGGNVTSSGDFIWCTPKAALLRDLRNQLRDGRITIDCLNPDGDVLEYEVKRFQQRHETRPGILNGTVCALALSCFARATMRDLALDPA